MAIKGLGSFDMMSTYNRISLDRPNTSENVKLPQAEAQSLPAELEKKEEEAPKLSVNLNLEGMRSRANYNFDDISRDFSGRDAGSISRVDDKEMFSEMSKALSLMEKDKSIQQYQYFVGGSNVILNNEDGIVITK